MIEGEVSLEAMVDANVAGIEMPLGREPRMGAGDHAGREL